LQIEKGEMIKGALIVFDACLKFCASCTVIDVTNRRIYSTKQWQIQGGGAVGAYLSHQQRNACSTLSAQVR